MLHNLFFHIEALPLPHCVHVLPGLVLGIRLLPKVQVLLLSGWHPEGVTGNDLKERRRQERPGEADVKFCQSLAKETTSAKGISSS